MLNKIFGLLTTIEVRLVMNSGHVHTFYCRECRIKQAPDNDLLSINVQGSSGFPLYSRLDDISLVLTRRVFRW